METKNRIEKAVELFKSGYNCSQSVVGAFADMYGFTEEQAFRMSASFGGGIGRMRQTCLLYTSDAADDLIGVDLGGRRIIKKKFFQAEDGIRDHA